MRLWLGGEIEADVADDYRTVRNLVEPVLDAVVVAGDYGGGVAKLALVAIVMSAQSLKNYPEVKRFGKRDKIAEFRLAINHSRFKTSDNVGRAKLLVGTVLQSLDLMESMGIAGVDVSAIRKDITATAAAKGWLQ